MSVIQKSISLSMGLILGAFLFLDGCSSTPMTEETNEKNISGKDYVEVMIDSWLDKFNQWAFPKDSYEKAPADTMLKVEDYSALYEDDIENPVLYLTVGRREDFGNSGHTWEEVNDHDLQWYEDNGLDVYESDALVQFGNEDGPTSDSFGYGNMSANATVRVTGTKASRRQQKSYRIKIDAGSGNIDGIKTIILSKGFSDPFRFTNKLCFDLMSEIDEMMSTRTQFVHLYVRDENSEDTKLFVDYGLYTMVETVNKKYLSNRNLDSSGELYKAENFDFGRHSDVIMQPTSVGFDQKSFEKLLEAKGSSDYSCLIKLLDDLNDDSKPIEEIVDTYFDEDNLYTWMAFNILVDNKAADTDNFYIYSPTGTDRFYFISWDPDGALRADYELLRDPDYTPGWERGIYLYSDSVLFSKILRSEHCVNKLSEKITALHETALSSEAVALRAEELSETVKQYLFELPDISYARVTAENYDRLVAMLPEQIDNNYYAYYDSLETPWPFHITEPVLSGGKVVINWDESYVLNGNVVYDVELARSWDFSKKIIDVRDVADTSYNCGHLAPGQYFARVTARTEGAGRLTQEAYEYYSTEKKTTVHGVLCFYVSEDSTIRVSSFQNPEEN